MKFKPEFSQEILSDGTLEADYAQAQEVGRVRLGARCLYLRKLSGAAYVPCGQIIRAWLRQEEVKAKLCCATANFDQFFLVMACADGRARRWHIPGKAEGQQCLDHITAKNPDVKIGYVTPEK